MTSSQVIKCAKCNVPLEGRTIDSKPEGMFSCPVCGQGDTYVNILREVGDYAKEQMADYLAAGLKKATQSSKYVTFRESRRPKRGHRFVVDLGL